MGSLDDIRVIDFGQYVAGPVAGMMLADHGAEVIRIDPPGGPMFDTPANATWNRGKKSICLDLKQAADRDTAAALIKSADVVIENFRPAVMDRLGLGHEAMRTANPSLIYASMPGFAQEDPRSAMPAWEGVIFAALDVFRPLATYADMVPQLHKQHRDGTPTFTAEPIASMYAALLSCVSIAAALEHRRRTGRGQRIELPLFDAMIQEIGVYALSRVPFKPITGAVFAAWDHQFQCADGRWVHIVCTNPRHMDGLAKAMGRPDFIERGFTAREIERQPDNNAELMAELKQIFRTRTGLEWEALLMEAGLPGAMCRSSAEWLQHPHAHESDLLTTVDDPKLGVVRQPGIQVKLSQTPGGVRGPAPLPDADREAILAGVQSHALPQGAASSDGSGLPLEGLRVLDLCIILAGPTCGRTLAELGADVIKIDDPQRGPVSYHQDINRGKRTILLDLDTPEGKEIFWQLVESTDIIVENYRKGVVERLGVDYESVRKRKPAIIYASLNAYGDTGPWAGLPGYEETAQALTGMQVRYGGANEPIIWPYGVCNDYGTGYAGAFGVLMALHVRARTGAGQRVHSALARTACMLQSMYMQDYAGKRWTEPHGPGALGFGPLQRLYECADGWIYLGAKDAAQLEAVVGAARDEAELEGYTGDWCAQRSAVDAVDALVAGGVGAHVLTWFNDALDSDIVKERKLCVTREHEGLGTLRTSGPGPWFSASRNRPGNPAPLPGRDAQSILAEIGRAGDLPRLVEAGVIMVPAGEINDPFPE